MPQAGLYLDTQHVLHRQQAVRLELPWADPVGGRASRDLVHVDVHGDRPRSVLKVNTPSRNTPCTRLRCQYVDEVVASSSFGLPFCTPSSVLSEHVHVETHAHGACREHHEQHQQHRREVVHSEVEPTTGSPHGRWYDNEERARSAAQLWTGNTPALARVRATPALPCRRTTPRRRTSPSACRTTPQSRQRPGAAGVDGSHRAGSCARPRRDVLHDGGVECPQHPLGGAQDASLSVGHGADRSRNSRPSPAGHGEGDTGGVRVVLEIVSGNPPLDDLEERDSGWVVVGRCCPCGLRLGHIRLMPRDRQPLGVHRGGTRTSWRPATVRTVTTTRHPWWSPSTLFHTVTG